MSVCHAHDPAGVEPSSAVQAAFDSQGNTSDTSVFQVKLEVAQRSKSFGRLAHQNFSYLFLGFKTLADKSASTLKSLQNLLFGYVFTC